MAEGGTGVYEAKSIQETINSLGTDRKLGLTEQEAARRLEEYGKNQLAESGKKSVFMMFLEQLNDPLIFVLLAATVISLLLGEISDAAIIVAVIALNAVVGIIQEGKAAKALETLKKMASPHAVVVRGGHTGEIAAAELVPGDIVLLEAGRQVPADLRLIQSVNLKIEESSLTGESVPVQKRAEWTADGAKEGKIALGDCKNMAFSSTGVTYGRGKGVVTATGMDTQIGRIAGLLHENGGGLTPLQKRLADLGKVLSLLSVGLCVLLFAVAVWQQRNTMEMLLTAISLAVAAVPEGLPAVVTIVLALSVSRMVRVHTIVRRLPCVETLGTVDVVCSDKTGTLTQNRMTVLTGYADGRFYSLEEMAEKRTKPWQKAGRQATDLLAEGLILCNDASIQGRDRLGDPTELALLDMGRALGLEKEKLEQEKPRVGELPFDSGRKMMSTCHRDGRGQLSYTKGAVDMLLPRCSHIYLGGREMPLTKEGQRKLLQAAESMSDQALRVLALAMRREEVPGGSSGGVQSYAAGLPGGSGARTGPVEEGLTFVGLVGMMDPPRPEAAAAVEQFREAGVDTVMITGDHVQTALAIARELGIAHSRTECMEGAQLNRLSDDKLQQQVSGIHVFARVSPEHKVRIVKALQAQGKTVAMTGDGVNDAPSLKTADIGIAMGKNGTDVARGAADMVLADDNFATIEKAIAQGRGVYENIRKTVLFLLSSNFGEVLTMLIAVIFGLPSPLKASHILWINLITDSLPALALGVDANDSRRLMKRAPRNARESLFADGGLSCTLCYGLVIGCISLAAFLKVPIEYLQANRMEAGLAGILTALESPAVVMRAQTHAFTVLGISQLFHAVGMRDVSRSIFRQNPFGNLYMLLALGMGLFLQLLVTEVPYFVNAFGTVKLQAEEWGQLTVWACMPLLVHELFCFSAFLSHKSIFFGLRTTNLGKNMIKS